MATKDGRGPCLSCAHFRNDPAYLEQAFAGLTSLSSGYSSTRSDDGICLLHDRHLSARASCAKFIAKRAAGAATVPVAAVCDTSLKSSTEHAIERMLMV